MAIDGADVSNFTVPQLTALLSAKNVIRMQVLPRSAARHGCPAAASVSATTFSAFDCATSSTTNRSISTLGTLLLLNYMNSSTDSSDVFVSHASLQKVAELR
jgi:hypothetical protein